MENMIVNKGCFFGRSKIAAAIAFSGLAFSGVAAVAQDDLGALVPAPLVTAPSIRPGILGDTNLGHGTARVTAMQPTIPAAGPVAESENHFPWVLSSEQHPWPLRYQAPTPLNRLYLTLPSVQEARIMYPGRSADEATRLRREVERYITTAIAMAAQHQARQLEQLREWGAKVDTLKQSLPSDPWVAYQFAKEVRDQLDPFMKQAEGQGADNWAAMVQDIQALVAKVSPLMEAMPSYELKMAWYDSLKNLKEGAGIYRTQTTAAEAQINGLLASLADANPVTALPEGRKPNQLDKKLPTAGTLTQTPGAVSIQAEKTPAQPMPAKEKSEGSLMGGAIVFLGMGAAVIGLFMKLRSRVKGIGKSSKINAE